MQKKDENSFVLQIWIVDWVNQWAGELKASHVIRRTDIV